LRSPSGDETILDNGASGGIRHLWSGSVQKANASFASGRWTFSIRRRRGPEEPTGGKVFLVVLVNVGAAFPNPVVVYGPSVHGAVPIYADIGMNTYSSTTIALSKLPELTQSNLALVDDGLNSPDVEKGDGVRSQFFFDAETTGPYEALLELRPSGSVASAAALRFPVASLWTEGSGRQVVGRDVIPPSQITDLRAKLLVEERKVRLSWTAPGDNLNYGQGNKLIKNEVMVLLHFPLNYSIFNIILHINIFNIQNTFYS